MYIYIHKYIRICIYIYMYIGVCVCVCVCVCGWVYVYIPGPAQNRDGARRHCSRGGSVVVLVAACIVGALHVTGLIHM